MRFLLLILVLGASWLTWYRASLAEARLELAPSWSEALGATIHSGVAGCELDLVQGRADLSTGPGASERVVWTLLEATATGDLDRDGAPERVVVGVVQTGGSGSWRELVVLGRDGERLAQRACLDLGDRVEVQSVAVDGDRVLVALVTHGHGDGLSAPSVPVLRVLRLEGDRLVPVGA